MSNANNSLVSLEVNIARFLTVYGYNEVVSSEFMIAYGILCNMQSAEGDLSCRGSVYKEYTDYLHVACEGDEQRFVDILTSPTFRDLLKDVDLGSNEHRDNREQHLD